MRQQDITTFMKQKHVILDDQRNGSIWLKKIDNGGSMIRESNETLFV